MSLFSLGADAAKRRAAAPSAAPAAGAWASPPAPAASSGDNPLQALVLFLPAETVAIFVTVATALFAAFPSNAQTAAWSWYVFCLVLTPIFTWIGFATRWRKDHAGAYPPFAATPWFRIIASIAAFAAWGLAVAPQIGSEILCRAVVTTTSATSSGAATTTTTTCNAEAISGILVVVIAAILAVLDGLIDYKP